MDKTPWNPRKDCPGMVLSDISSQRPLTDSGPSLIMTATDSHLYTLEIRQHPDRGRAVGSKEKGNCAQHTPGS